MSRRRNVPLAPQLAAGMDDEAKESEVVRFMEEVSERFAQDAIQQVPVKVRFEKAETPVFVPHDVGRVLPAWRVLCPSAPGHVYTAPGRPPTEKGNWLMSSVDRMECQIDWNLTRETP